MFGRSADRLQERALRVLLGLQPLTTTAVTILPSHRLAASRLQSYLLRVLPAGIFNIAGMARSYMSWDAIYPWPPSAFHT